jgi:hypothetical protein
MYITLLITCKTYLDVISVTVQLRCKLTEGKLVLSMADSSWYTLYTRTYCYFEVNLWAMFFLPSKNAELYISAPNEPWYNKVWIQQPVHITEGLVRLCLCVCVCVCVCVDVRQQYPCVEDPNPFASCSNIRVDVNPSHEVRTLVMCCHTMLLEYEYLNPWLTVRNALTLTG